MNLISTTPTSVVVALMLSVADPSDADAQKPIKNEKPIKYELGGFELSIGEATEDAIGKLKLSYSVEYDSQRSLWDVSCLGKTDLKLGALFVTDGKLTKIVEIASVTCSDGYKPPSYTYAMLLTKTLEKVRRYSGGVPCQLESSPQNADTNSRVFINCGAYMVMVLSAPALELAAINVYVEAK